MEAWQGQAEFKHFDRPTDNPYIGTTYWMRGAGTVDFKTQHENQPLGLAWKVYLTHPQQHVNVIFNGRAVAEIPASGVQGWSLTRGSVLLTARKGINTLELRPNIVSSAAAPVKDVPDGRSILIVDLTLKDFSGSRVASFPERGSSVVLALMLIFALARLLRPFSRKSHV